MYTCYIIIEIYILIYCYCIHVTLPYIKYTTSQEIADIIKQTYKITAHCTACRVSMQCAVPKKYISRNQLVSY